MHRTSNTILLTRPQQESQDLAKKLTKIGYQCLIHPLLTIQPCPLEQKEFDAYIITSRQALHALKALQVPVNTPLFCVGAETAKEAKKAGFQTYYTGKTVSDMLSFFAAPNTTYLQYNFLYARSDTISHDLTTLLRKTGYTIAEQIAYEAVATKTLSPEIIELLQQDAFAYVAFFSKRTAQIFLHLLRQHRIPLSFLKTDLIAFSRPIAHVLRPVTFKKRHILRAPTLSSFMKRMHILASPESQLIK